MAWIEVHQDLRWHWKVERLAKDLSIEKAHALGLITALWLWAVSNARDGQVARFTPRELCAACGWNGPDEARFVELLKQHELIDPDGRIHDWEKHGTRLLDQARQRVMKHRLDDGRSITRNVTGNASLGKKESKREGRKDTPPNDKATTVHPPQPHQQLIDRFLALKGVDPANKPQVAAWYKRHSRSALALIKESGGLAYALSALEAGAALFTEKHLSWTLDTIAKHLPDLLNGRRTASGSASRGAGARPESRPERHRQLDDVTETVTVKP